MTTKKTIHLRGLLKEVSSQRVQYKPYGYTLGFEDPKFAKVYVEFDIPESSVVEDAKGSPGQDHYVVVNLDGLKAILQVTADAIDELNKKHLNTYSE